MDTATRKLLIDAGKLAGSQLAEHLDDQFGYALDYLECQPEHEGAKPLSIDDEPEDGTEAEYEEYEAKLAEQQDVMFVGFLADLTGREPEDVERFLNETR